MRKSVVGAALISLMAMVNPVWSYVVPKVSLREVSRNSDAIIVGQVISVDVNDEALKHVRDVPIGDATEWKAVLAINQVIKGELHTGTVVVSYVGPQKDGQGMAEYFMLREHLTVGETVVLYLRANVQAGGAYSFANEFKSAIRIEGSPFLMSSNAAQSRLKGDYDQEVILWLSSSLNELSGDKFENALSDLVELQGSQAGKTIDDFLKHAKDPKNRGVALVMLFRIGDYSRLAEGVDLLSSCKEGLGETVMRRLSAQMANIQDEELACKFCIPLMCNTNDFVRYDAVRAIRHAKCRAAVPHLMKGLSDRDVRIRYQCYMGLAEIVGRSGDRLPSRNAFEINESDYIRFWKSWWDSNGQLEYKH